MAYKRISPMPVIEGGTGNSTLTAHSILLGEGTAAITALGLASNGQIPIGSTGANPVLATLTAGAGISVTNGAGSITLASTVTQGIVTINGNVSSITGTTVTIRSPATSGTAQFDATTSTNMNLIFDDGIDNVILGGGLTTIPTGGGNTGLGWLAFQNGSVTTGSQNVGIGYESFLSLTSGSHNTAIGQQPLLFLTTGNYNLSIGAYQSGLNYTSSETSNILVGSPGVTGESNVIRIGSQGTGNAQQDAAYIAGVYNTAVGSTSGITLTDSTGKLGSLASASNGQVLIGSTGATPVLATLTAGAGVGITNAAGSITITSSGGGFTWTVVSGTTQAIVASNGYIANNAGTVTLTLPSTSAVGDTYQVCGINNATGWKIAQNASQSINFGNQVTTTGTGGSLESTATNDAIQIICTVANTSFIVLSSIGNITVV